MQSYFAVDTTNVKELNRLIFSETQEKLNNEIDFFAENFDSCPISIESLTKTYATLTGCQATISKNKCLLDPSISQSLNNTQQLLNQALSTMSKKQGSIPDSEEKRAAYLAEKELREKALMEELRKKSDQLDEYYTKKTRESIYKNLVGANQWDSIQQ
ncbi:hypothetical protein BY458DRAFT_559949 [Sporodiniella umbellata]|nr:hypothetical protein BY458DRAFT_559949 [Sporodiniella umbellata]